MSVSFADSLLKVLAQQVGIPELALDESSCCVLAFDEVVINFEADASSQRLFLYADVGDAPEGLPESLYRELLEANLMWGGTGGATLSLDGSARRFMLAHGVPVGRTSDVDFLATVETFVDIVECWRTRIAESAQVQGETPQAEEETERTRPIPATEFV